MSRSSVTAQTLLLLAPLVIFELVLMVAALVDLIKREKVTGGNKLVWVLLIIFINIIGPLVYFIWGRKEA